jgi:hypothetical protein
VVCAHFMVSEGLIGLAGTKKTVGPLPGRQGEDLVDAFARNAAGPKTIYQPGNSTVSITWITPFDCITLRMVT